MTDQACSGRPLLFLGIEGGGTRTVAILADEQGPLQRLEAGPANLRLVTDRQLLRLFRSVARKFPPPDALGIGLAGVRGEQDHARILNSAAQVWPGLPCVVSHDLETALLAAESTADSRAQACVVVLSGTGSCCYGRARTGPTAKVGGWGHLLGDKGSGYEIGLRALKAVVYYYDRDGIWPKLGQRLLRVLQLNEPNDLIQWAQNADKRQIAALACEVFQAWARREKIARDILEGAAHSLAKDAVACAKRLVRLGEPVQFVFAGGVLLSSPRFAQWVARTLRGLWPRAKIEALKLESAWGAVRMAQEHFTAQAAAWNNARPSATPKRPHNGPEVPAQHRSLPARSANSTLQEDLRRSPTEQRNPRSANLDKMTVGQAIRLMLSEEQKTARALLREQKAIARAIRLISRALGQGGRLFYVGAGTSGRLGVLDASECPPTFRTTPDQVQGIMAGGAQALWSSVEGAEDDAAAGAEAIRFRGVRQADVVVGIAASGRTPFVWGALEEAQRRHARTVLICFNPALRLAKARRPDLVIAPNVGPEVLTGSTRLKAGTATKLILNILTTLSMVRLGKVVSNLMVDLNPSNTKLRDRAVRIVRDLTGADETVARQALTESGWIVKRALARLKARR